MKILMPNGHIYDFWNFKHAGPDDSPDALGNTTPAGLRLDYITHAFSEGTGTAFTTVDSVEGVLVSWSIEECKELWKHFISGAYGEEALNKVMEMMDREGIEKMVVVEGEEHNYGTLVPLSREEEVTLDLLLSRVVDGQMLYKVKVCELEEKVKKIYGLLTNHEKVILNERLCTEVCKKIDAPLGGLTGAQYGQAAWLAWQWCHNGGPAALMERYKENGKDDRTILVSKDWPRV